MGYDERQKSNSSAVVVGVVLAVVLVVGLFGGLAVAGSLFWVSTSRVQVQRAMVAEERALAAAQRARMPTVAEIVESEATPAQEFRLAVTVDRAGGLSVDGESLDLAGLSARLTNLKKSNPVLVQINADSECPVKHLVAVTDVVHQVGDVDYNIAASAPADESHGEVAAEK